VQALSAGLDANVIRHKLSKELHYLQKKDSRCSNKAGFFGRFSATISNSELAKPGIFVKKILEFL